MKDNRTEEIFGASNEFNMVLHTTNDFIFTTFIINTECSENVIAENIKDDCDEPY